MPKQQPSSDVLARIHKVLEIVAEARVLIDNAAPQIEVMDTLGRSHNKAIEQSQVPGMAAVECERLLSEARRLSDETADLHKSVFRPATVALNRVYESLAALTELLPTKPDSSKIVERINALALMKTQGMSSLTGRHNIDGDLDAIGRRLIELEELFPQTGSKSALVTRSLPEGTNWEQVCIRVIDEHTVQIVEPIALEPIHYKTTPFLNRRSQLPKKGWQLFEELAKGRGELGAAFVARKGRESRVKEFNRDFSQLLNLTGKAVVFRRSGKSRSYVALFSFEHPRSTTDRR